MQFEYPWSLLVLGALVPLFLAFRRSDATARDVLRIMKAPANPARFQWLRYSLAAAFVACLTVVAARPYATPGRTGDFIFLVDTSRSMQASNFCGEPTFLDRARESIARIVSAVPEGRFGIMVFDRLAFPVTPMTFDHAYLREVLDNGVFTGMTYEATRTNLANALQAFAAKKRHLPGIYGEVGHVIVLSDGWLREQDWRQELSAATDELRRVETEVVALGIGNAEPTPIHAVAPGGGCLEELIRIDGNVVSVPRVRDTLIKAAEETQGRYFEEAELDQAVEYLRVNGLNRIPPAGTEWREEQRRYLSNPFLVSATFALLLLLIWERRSL